jgi:hypothetical protein
MNKLKVTVTYLLPTDLDRFANVPSSEVAAVLQEKWYKKGVYAVGRDCTYLADILTVEVTPSKGAGNEPS